MSLENPKTLTPRNNRYLDILEYHQQYLPTHLQYETRIVNETLCHFL